MPLRIETPSIQNWSCHGCSQCCRGGFLIELSEAEKQRIEEQGWKESDGVGVGPLMVLENGQYRLNHKDDGACVFLDETGRCRIHARFGEPAKPRACRLYPLVFHPLGGKVALGLRFSCPSAAANSGKPLPAQLPALRDLAELVVSDDFSEIPAPAVLRDGGLSWPDFMRYVGWLEKIMEPPNLTVSVKMRRALHVVNAIEKADFDHLSGREADEILGALYQNALTDVPRTGSAVARVTGINRLLFRTLVFTYARRDSVGDNAAGIGQRLKWLGAMIRFARASGRTPAMSPDLSPVEFGAIEKSFGPLPPEAEATLTRFFRVKIQSLHFCGRAFYDFPLVEGFNSLALLYPVILWLARWHAAAMNRSTLTEKDIEQAIVEADRHHGYSPAFATNWSRRRARLLAQKDSISRLCAE